MRNGEDSSGLLEAGYDGIKLELKETESDIEKLQARAEKLRAALSALRGLISEPAPTNGAADGAVSLKHDTDVSARAEDGYHGVF